MIALDTNIIVYCLVSSVPENERARRWILSNEDKLVTTGVNIAEVLRLLTHPQVFQKPLRINAAVKLLNQWIDDFNIQILDEDENWWKQLPTLLNDNPSLKGNDVYDARIALVLRFHGVKSICTLDADFSKYSFLKPVRI